MLKLICFYQRKETNPTLPALLYSERRLTETEQFKITRLLWWTWDSVGFHLGWKKFSLRVRLTTPPRQAQFLQHQVQCWPWSVSNWVPTRLSIFSLGKVISQKPIKSVISAKNKGSSKTCGTLRIIHTQCPESQASSFINPFTHTEFTQTSL